MYRTKLPSLSAPVPVPLAIAEEEGVAGYVNLFSSFGSENENIEIWGREIPYQEFEATKNECFFGVLGKVLSQALF